MNLPPLSACFPISESLAELYGGWSEGPIFKKYFTAKSLNEAIKKTNSFLKKHDFDIEIDPEEFKDSKFIEVNDFTFAKDVTTYNQVLMAYHQPLMNKPLDNILEFLNSFKAQSDNNKTKESNNMASSISSMGNAMAQLFTSDDNRNLNEKGVENKLADILINCIHLADEYNIDLLDAVVSRTINNHRK